MLTSLCFNQSDYNYFRENYELVDTNVSSLDEANVVLLGESHFNKIHHIKNCWLINKLIRDNDTIYLEGVDENGLITKNDFEKIFNYPIYSKVKFKSWDNYKIVRDSSLSDLKFIKLGKFLKENIDKYNNNLLSDQNKIDIIRKMDTFLSKNLIREKLNTTIKEHKSLFETESKVILFMLSCLNKFSFNALMSKETANDKLDAHFIFAVFHMAIILETYPKVNLSMLDFIKRNISYSKSINEENGNYFGISGKLHLQNETPIREVDKGIEILMEALKEKKFVILFPTDSNENIKHVEKFFKNSNTQEIQYFLKLFFLFLAFGLAGKLTIDCTDPIKKFIFMSMISLLVGYILLKCVLYSDDLSDTDLQILIKDLKKSLESLSDLIKNKVDSIPNELKSQIDSEYFKYLEQEAKSKL